MIDLKRKALTTTVMLAGVLALAGCETTNGGSNTVEKGIWGALAGAAAGAIIGNNAGSGDAQSGALIGAVIGGAGGAYAGCREDGGCGSQPQTRNYDHDYSRQQNVPTPTQTDTVNKRQFFDNNTGRYYFYDPVSRNEYYENGEPKNN
jgi:phage tail tape-measure protein